MRHRARIGPRTMLQCARGHIRPLPATIDRSEQRPSTSPVVWVAQRKACSADRPVRSALVHSTAQASLPGAAPAPAVARLPATAGVAAGDTTTPTPPRPARGASRTTSFASSVAASGHDRSTPRATLRRTQGGGGLHHLRAHVNGASGGYACGRGAVACGGGGENRHQLFPGDRRRRSRRRRRRLRSVRQAACPTPPAGRTARAGTRR